MSEEQKKFNCYKCKHKGIVPGSCHISCNHPSLDKIKDDPIGEFQAMFSSVGRMPPIVKGSEELNIKGHPQGIRRGWFNFPYNFDPTWLINCDGYKSKGGDSNEPT